MINVRWTLLLSLTLALFSLASQATIYSSPMLNEANGLIDISPNQAKNLATEYLAERKLAEKAEKSSSVMARDESDSLIRTPGSSIDALKILAKAEFQLHNMDAALAALKLAEQLTQHYQLPYLAIDVQILKTRLIWFNNNDASTARQALRAISIQYDAIKNADQVAKGLDYKITLLKAEIASKANDIELANKLFADLKPYIDSISSPKTVIEYQIVIGQHFLTHGFYNRALSELLVAYWGAIENNSSALLAKTNTLLAQLFFERKVLDKALEHLSQAADFYDGYNKSPALADVLQRMGDVYYQQGKYNLALVHYFNVIDHETSRNDLEKVIEVRISLAATYLSLYNYPLTDQYLTRAEDLLELKDYPRLKAQAYLLHSGLAFHQKQADVVISNAQHALSVAKTMQDEEIEEHAYRLLALGYEQNGQYAQALENIKRSNALSQIRQEKLNQISEDAFRQQKEFVEQTLHLVGQEKALLKTQEEYNKFKKIAFILFIISIILFLLLLRRGYLIQLQNEEIDELNSTLFTHSRSRLRNLRMLNAKLPSAMQKSSRHFEPWYIGELIHEPLSDRLRFVMIDIPFLRNMYLEHGYSAGLELEHQFGHFLKSKIKEPNRIYHFSDSNLLYIEPNADRNTPPEIAFDRIQQWIDEFQPERRLNRTIRMGIADYPFLPRAYMAINDKELLDILLMATNTARQLSMREGASHWVYLKAIDNAPAASFASNNIRKSCKHAINQGLIKVHSSYKNEESIKKLLKDG